MSDVMEKPRTANPGPNIQAAEAGDISHSPTGRVRITLTRTADQLIRGWSDGLTLGTTELWEVPWSIAELWTNGFDTGRSMAICPDHDRLVWERDLFYFLACNPGKNQNDFNRAITNDLWRQAVAA